MLLQVICCILSNSCHYQHSGLQGAVEYLPSSQEPRRACMAPPPLQSIWLAAFFTAAATISTTDTNPPPHPPHPHSHRWPPTPAWKRTITQWQHQSDSGRRDKRAWRRLPCTAFPSCATPASYHRFPVQLRATTYFSPCAADHTVRFIRTVIGPEGAPCLPFTHLFTTRMNHGRPLFVAPSYPLLS